jgi:hypothetical protein
VSAQVATLPERADACLDALDDAGRALAQRMLLRLVSFPDGRSETRRSQPISALTASGDPDRIGEILRRLTEAQVVAIDGDPASEQAQVQLADDSLLSWPRLKAWIQRHGRAEQLRRQLESDATEWSQRAGQGPGEAGLLDKDQLRELAGWLTPDARRELGVSELTDSFITASRTAARRRRWPARSSFGGLFAVGLILAIMATPITLLLIVVLAASVVHSCR